MATERQNNSGDSLDSQAPTFRSRYAGAPRVVITLHDLEEVRSLWGIGVDRIYRAVARGLLHAYGRPGRQKYYSEAELVAAFGEPLNGPFRPTRTGKSPSGGYQQGFEFSEHRRDVAA